MSKLWMFLVCLLFVSLETLGKKVSRSASSSASSSEYSSSSTPIYGYLNGELIYNLTELQAILQSIDSSLNSTSSGSSSTSNATNPCASVKTNTPCTYIAPLLYGNGDCIFMDSPNCNCVCEEYKGKQSCFFQNPRWWGIGEKCYIFSDCLNWNGNPQDCKKADIPQGKANYWCSGSCPK